MKYTTFRTSIVVGVVALVGAGAVAAFVMHQSGATVDSASTTPADHSPDTKELAEDSVPSKHAMQSPSTTTTTAPSTPVTAADFDKIANAKLQPMFDANANANASANANANALRDVDRDVLGLVKAGAAGDKLKDAAKGKPYKVDLHSDDGKAWNRVKIDLDRDGKWDEKWSLKDGAWHREVASADDEVYDAKYVLHEGVWKPK